MLNKQETAILNVTKFISTQCTQLRKKLELAGETDLLDLVDGLEEHAKKVNEEILTHYEDAKYAPKLDEEPSLQCDVNHNT